MELENKLVQLSRRNKESEVRLTQEVSALYDANGDGKLVSYYTELPLTKCIEFSLEIEKSKFSDGFISIVFHFYNTKKRDKTIWFKTHVFKVITNDSKVDGREWVSSSSSIYSKLVLRGQNRTPYVHQFYLSSTEITDGNSKIDIVGIVEEVSAVDYVSLDENLDDSQKSYQDTLKIIYENDNFKDFKFLIEGQTLMAHKAVLAAKSKVFNSMLTLDTKERQDGFVEINDARMNVFEAFVKFLYTNQIEHIEDLAEDLLAVADKYDVEDLKKKCENYLSKILNKENAVDFLIKADLYNCEKLKHNALQFVKFFIKDCKDFQVLLSNKRLLDELLVLIDEDIKNPLKKMKLDNLELTGEGSSTCLLDILSILE